jgi:hypothetical protein
VRSKRVIPAGQSFGPGRSWTSEGYSYATAGRNAKIDWKALSKRIIHADVAFTMKQYVQTDLEADREIANTLADLIISGLLITGDIIDQGNEGRLGHMQEALPGCLTGKGLLDASYYGVFLSVAGSSISTVSSCQS